MRGKARREPTTSGLVLSCADNPEPCRNLPNTFGKKIVCTNAYPLTYIACVHTCLSLHARFALLGLAWTLQMHAKHCFVHMEHNTKICALQKDLIELGARDGLKAVAPANAASKNTARVNALISIFCPAFDGLKSFLFFQKNFFEKRLLVCRWRYLTFSLLFHPKHSTCSRLHTATFAS